MSTLDEAIADFNKLEAEYRRLIARHSDHDEFVTALLFSCGEDRRMSAHGERDYVIEMLCDAASNTARKIGN